MCTCLLVMTVGTGTTGDQSNLVQGLRNTLVQTCPRRFWLVPSSSEYSRLVAELVAEDQPAFAGYLGPIENPDQLECCRRTLREAIQQVRRELRPGEVLMVNPTSGTKQMSAGATIAALDEGIGHITFTVGQRRDGVVITGTEKVVAFDPADYFKERDEQTARTFFKEGDFYAARCMLASYRHAGTTPSYAVANLCYHWQRFDYQAAAGAAAVYDQQLHEHLKECGSCAGKNRPYKGLVADLLAWADFALRHNQAEEASRLIYKSLEQSARLLLAQDCGIEADDRGLYSPRVLDKVNRPELWQQQQRAVPLGLKLMLNVLQGENHPFGDAVLGNAVLKRLMDMRNVNTHSLSPVSQLQVQEAYESVLRVIHEYYPDLQPTSLPC